MSIKENIIAGKYSPIMPYMGEVPSIGDYKHLAIARVEVYPVGYDPYADLKPGQQRLKPTYEYYLDVLTLHGTFKYRINVKDRKEGEDLLFFEVLRIQSLFFADLGIVHNDIHNDSRSTLFFKALNQRLHGFQAVADEYASLHVLIDSHID